MSYIQCKLEKENCVLVSYIEEKYAKEGKYISLFQDGKFVSGWIVLEVYHNSKRENPPDYRKSIRSHKKHTGDSLPKQRK